jgi:hypothetical protein
MNGQIGGEAGDGQEIDLGQPSEAAPPGMADMPQGSGAPTGGGAPIYPSMMLSGDQGLSKIPDSGRAHINFHVSSRRQHTPSHGPHKGKQRHEVELHVHSIRPIRGYKKAASKSAKSPDEKAMAKLMGDQDEEE